MCAKTVKKYNLKHPKMKSVLNTVDCNASVINISDDVICISDDMIVISSDSDMSGSECGSVIIVGRL